MSDKLLKNAEASGLYHLPAIGHAALARAADQARFVAYDAHIPVGASIEDALQTLGSAFQFPIWYGANFDALFDCLSDPDWQPGKGHLLLISGMGKLRVSSPADFATLVSVLEACVEARHANHQPFWIVIDTPARGIPLFPEA